jgi:hypothetical protein
MARLRAVTRGANITGRRVDEYLLATNAGAIVQPISLLKTMGVGGTDQSSRAQLRQQAHGQMLLTVQTSMKDNQEYMQQRRDDEATGGWMENNAAVNASRGDAMLKLITDAVQLGISNDHQVLRAARLVRDTRVRVAWCVVC